MSIIMQPILRRKQLLPDEGMVVTSRAVDGRSQQSQSEIGRQPRNRCRAGIGGVTAPSPATLNTVPPEATVFYRFHPLYSRSFSTVQRSGGLSGRITLRIAADKTLSVPQWMLNAEAQQLSVIDAACVPSAVLLSVVALLDAAWFAAVRVHNTPEPDHAAATPLAR